MFSIDAIVEKKIPTLTKNYPFIKKTVCSLLRFLTHERRFIHFQKQYPHAQGFDFVEQVLRYFEFDYRVFTKELERIPVKGRAIVVANHPLGSLDGLALLQLIKEVRSDVRIVANEMLYAIEALRPLLITVDNMNNKTRKESIKAIKNWLNADGVLIIFPAGEVSRLSSTGIKDSKWNAGFLRFAETTQSPIVPLFIDGRNSLFFYALSLLARPISSLWLIREMFKQAKHHIDIRVGHIIYPEQLMRLEINNNAKAKLIRKHVYKLNKGKSVLGFEPEYEAIAHPENRQQLKQEMLRCEHLGETNDGKKIFLYQYSNDSVIMRELGRLRELSFRAAKEGTGKRRDIDHYDTFYDHIILWDDKTLEIIGAYRMVQTGKINHTPEHTLYTQTLFDLTTDFDDRLLHGLELGRSFIQPQFWGMRNLDYLWYGIGAYLRKYPTIKTLFGPVSISHHYSDNTINLLTYFYQHYFPCQKTYAIPKNAYLMNEKNKQEIALEFSNLSSHAERLNALKALIKKNNESIPTLYKQYGELCEEGGVEFSGFNLDPQFSNCIDGFIVIDVDKIKINKKNRYIQNL